MATTGIRKIRNMVDKVGEGDLSGAQDAFDAAVMARREAQMANYKTHLAQNAFQPPESHPGQDTGITGEPGEVDEDKAYDDAVAAATDAHAKGNVKKSKAIMKNASAKERQRRDNIKNWGKESVDEQRPSQKKIRKMSYVDQATQAHVDGDFKKRDAILKAGAAARKKKEAQNSEYVPQGDELDELTLTNPFKKKKTPEQRGALGSQPGYKLGKRTGHDETPVKTPASRIGRRD